MLCCCHYFATWRSTSRPCRWSSAMHKTTISWSPRNGVHDNRQTIPKRRNMFQRAFSNLRLLQRLVKDKLSHTRRMVANRWRWHGLAKRSDQNYWQSKEYFQVGLRWIHCSWKTWRCLLLKSLHSRSFHTWWFTAISPCVDSCSRFRSYCGLGLEKA